MLGKYTNKIYLTGRVQPEISIRYLDYNKPLVRLRIEVEEAPATEEAEALRSWHRLVAMDEVALFIEREVSEGDLIALSGKLLYRYERQTHGPDLLIAEIRVEEVKLLEKAAQKEQTIVSPIEIADENWLIDLDEYQAQEGEPPI